MHQKPFVGTRLQRSPNLVAGVRRAAERCAGGEESKTGRRQEEGYLGKKGEQNGYDGGNRKGMVEERRAQQDSE